MEGLFVLSLLSSPLPFLFPLLPFPSVLYLFPSLHLPLDVGKVRSRAPLNELQGLGSTGRAPAENEFGAL